MPLSLPLKDSFGRKFRYLRLSVTEVCNFRCVYCLPNGYQRKAGANPAPLSLSEVRNLVTGFAGLGVSKVRLTGGEPTTRGDIVELVRAVSSVVGIEKVALTTNGWQLARQAQILREAGLTALNVSVDSLDAERFRQMTGQATLDTVLDGVNAALEVGFPGVKINTVLMKGLNEQDLGAFLDWTKRQPVTVRFIELMKTGDNTALFEKHHVASSALAGRLLEAGWCRVPRPSGDSTDGPAVEFAHPEHLGRVGLISPYSPNFCEGCNRLRVSSRGALRLCLFGEGEFSLRKLLQSPEQRDELIAAVRGALVRKPEAHHLLEGNCGSTANLAAIGG